MSTKEIIRESGVAPIEDALMQALEQFDLVWAEYRQQGRGNSLTDNQAALLYRLTRSRVAHDVQSDMEPIFELERRKAGRIPKERLTQLGISDFGEERESLLRTGQNRGFLTRSLYLYYKTRDRVPIVVETKNAQIDAVDDELLRPW